MNNTVLFFEDVVRLYKDADPVKIKDILNGKIPTVNTDKTKVAHLLAGKVLEYREINKLTEDEYKNILKVIFELDNNFEVLLQYYEKEATLAVEQILSNPDYQLPIKNNQLFNKIIVGKFMAYIDNNTNYNFLSDYSGNTTIKKAQVKNFIEFSYQLDDESCILAMKKMFMSEALRYTVVVDSSWIAWVRTYKGIILDGDPCDKMSRNKVL